MKFKLILGRSIGNNHCIYPILLLLIGIFLSLSSYAQKRISLACNIGLFEPIGKDDTKIYYSDQPLTVEYYSRKKFSHPYIGILPNANYAISSSVFVGFQSGVYLHFNEEYSGDKKHLLVSIPILATGSINLFNIKSNHVGVSLAAGRNFFHMDTSPYDIKNGWLFNISAKYTINKKNIFKLGIEQQVDHGFYYFNSNSPFTHDETIKHSLVRTALALTYGILLK